MEPQPLAYDGTYLDRMEQVVDWAEEQDVHVIIDFHQDFYSFAVPGRGADGAPLWACPPPDAYNSSLPAWKKEFYDAIGLGSDPIVAFAHFWSNARIAATGLGVLEHYVRMVARVAERFVHRSAVLGIELMNEPLPDDRINIFQFANDTLYPFYGRVIQALTGITDGLPVCDAAHPIAPGCAHPSLLAQGAFEQIVLFEPMGLRNQLDFSPQWHIGPFSAYPNLIFAPHSYSHTFTKWKPPYNLSLDSAWREADRMRASVFVTEFGASSANEKLEGIVTEQDRHCTSSTFWPWKERGGWGMFAHTDNETDQNGPILDDHVQMLARVLPLATVGRLDDFAYNDTTSAFRMRATAPSTHGTRATAATTLVFVPGHIGDVAVNVTGAAKLVNVTPAQDGSRTVHVAPDTAGGEYTVALAPTRAALARHLSSVSETSSPSTRSTEGEDFDILPNGPSGIVDLTAACVRWWTASIQGRPAAWAALSHSGATLHALCQVPSSADGHI